MRKEVCSRTFLGDLSTLLSCFTQMEFTMRAQSSLEGPNKLQIILFRNENAATFLAQAVRNKVDMLVT